MTGPKMHPDEVDLSAPLVARLVADQFPQWSQLPVVAVVSAGTDHALFRLGDNLVVRLPRIAGAAGQVIKEQRWLPTLAPHLPLPTPVPVASGQPADDYPFSWSICRWLDGADATGRSTN
jgi:aminoglycoside phosphotransferase (APT) family kinase protein